jgi:hypothetical protein
MKRDGAEQAGMEWHDNFQPYAIILTERIRPKPIFVAAIIGAGRLLRVDFDLDGERKSYIKKSLEGVQCRSYLKQTQTSSMGFRISAAYDRTAYNHLRRRAGTAPAN